MILLDTNVLIYAHEPDSPFRSWAREIMEWPVATADPQRFKTYFPAVELETP